MHALSEARAGIPKPFATGVVVSMVLRTYGVPAAEVKFWDGPKRKVGAAREGLPEGATPQNFAAPHHIIICYTVRIWPLVSRVGKGNDKFLLPSRLYLSPAYPPARVVNLEHWSAHLATELRRML